MADHTQEEWIGDIGLVTSTAISGVASFYGGKAEVVIEMFSMLTDAAFSFTRDATDEEGLTGQEIGSTIVGIEAGWIAGTLTTRGLTTVGASLAGPIGAGVGLFVGSAVSKIYDYYSGNYDQRSEDEIWNLGNAPFGFSFPVDYGAIIRDNETGEVLYNGGNTDPAEQLARTSLYQMMSANAETSAISREFEKSIKAGMDPNEALELALAQAAAVDAEGGNAFRPGYSPREAQAEADARSDFYQQIPDDWKSNPALVSVVMAFESDIRNGVDPSEAHQRAADKLAALDDRGVGVYRQPDVPDEGAPTNTGTGGGSNSNDDNDDPATSGPAPAQPIKTEIKGDPKGTGGAVTEYKDRTHIQDGDGYTGRGLQAPIILDLDGDGVEVAFGEDIYFDLDDDGFLEQTSWASADDGFLVIDRNADGTRGAGDGVIDQSNELVLSSLGLEGDTDLQALARYDDNADGKLDASDAIWNELKVWQDLNQDGKTEGDGTELKTLAAWGISSINLAYDDGTDFTDESNDVEVFGNILHGLAVAA